MNRKAVITVSLVLIIFPGFLFAQIKNDNTLSVKVNNKEFNAKPRRVKLGRAVYYTGNLQKPETMLRIMLANFNGHPVNKSGVYLVIDADKPPKKKEIKKMNYLKKYDGIAAVRYVVETKSPRMRFHVGDSGNKGKTITVTNAGDGYLKITFNGLELSGTHWKERTTATVFGGLGRLEDKMTDKAISGATGYDWNIDPEGNGYRRTRQKDVIKLTDGKMIIKLEQ